MQIGVDQRQSER